MLLSLYDEEAVFECECEQASLNGHQALEAFWRPRPQTKFPLAFDLEDLKPDADGVTLDHRNHKGELVRDHFRFTDGGKILRTTCICPEKIG